MALIDNIISYWKLDETSGTTADDAHGSNDGTANNTRIFTAATAGKINTCADFTQGNDGITVPSFQAGEITVSAWIKGSLEDTHQKVIGRWENDANGHWILGIGAANTFWWEIRNGGATEVIQSGTFSAGPWFHILGTYDGDVSRLYVNGTELATNSDASGDLTNSGHDIYIGNLGGSLQFFDGLVDEVGVWSRALSPSEITSLYNSGNGLTYPFSAAILRLIKISGTFVDKPILTKVGGTFVDKPIKIKVGETFQDA